MTLRELRESKAYTQTELAAGVGVTSQAVYSWERGDYEPAFPRIRAIAQFLGVSIEDVRKALQETAVQKKK